MPHVLAAGPAQPPLASASFPTRRVPPLRAGRVARLPTDWVHQGRPPSPLRCAAHVFPVPCRCAPVVTAFARVALCFPAPLSLGL